MKTIIIIVIVLFIIYKLSNKKSASSVTGKNKELVQPKVSTSATTQIPDYLTEYYEESVLHIINAKDYYYQIIERFKRQCELIQMGSRTLDSSITKNDYKRAMAMYNKFKETKSKFTRIYGTGKIDLMKLIDKGIYYEATAYGKVVNYGGDTDAIVSYLADKDVEFKGAIKKRINMISKFSYANRKDDGSPLLNCHFWSELYSEFRYSSDDRDFDADELEELINYTVDFIDNLYRYSLLNK